MLTIHALRLDWRRVARRIERRLVEFMSDSGAGGYVVGLSGGLDSSVAACICARAVGKERVTGLILPDRKVTPHSDVEDATSLAKLLGVRRLRVDIDKIYSAFPEASSYYKDGAKIANANLRARIRMTLLYYYANSENALVLGTGDRSEILIGYYTKYGDGATDILPLGDLYKTQVRELAKYLRLPASIVSKPSSPHLWIGHTAQEELGIGYEVVDLILHGAFDLKLEDAEIARELDQPLVDVVKLLRRHGASEHKRRIPPVISMKGLR